MGAWELVLIMALVNADGPSIPANKTTWHANFEEAQKEAKQIGLPLVVHFYADWCGPCQSMEQSVLNSPDLKQQFGKTIVGVKINSDRQAALTQRLRVTALPTDVYLDPSGRELGRSVGSKGKAEYIAAVTALKSKLESRPAAARPVEIPVAALTPSGNAVTRPMETPKAEAQPNSVSLSAAPATPELPVLHQSERDRGYVVGLNGQSPVTFNREGIWKSGSSEFAVTHRGVSYRLCDADELAEFEAEPDRFVPSLHGCDPIVFQTDRKLSAGKTHWSATHDGRLYFFASAASRDRFQTDPARFAVDLKIQFFREQAKNEVSMR